MSRVEAPVSAMIPLDVHAHLVPIEPARLSALPGVEWRADDQTLVLDGHRIGMRNLFFPERLLEWMARRGIARTLISAPPPTYRQHLDRAAALAWTDYLNDGLLAIAAGSGGRLGVLRHLPLEHPELLPDLLARSDAAFEGVALAAGGHPGIEYSAACYEPLWQWLDARGSFVFLHPGTCADGRLARFYLENLVGNPYETGVAAAHLVMAGVPSRYPGIRFCLAHAGGIFPSLCGRLEKGFLTNRPGVDTGVERPLQAARRFWVDCVAHHPATLALARDIIGEDRVLFGSDWPFPMGIDDPDESGVRSLFRS